MFGSASLNVLDSKLVHPLRPILVAPERAHPAEFFDDAMQSEGTVRPNWACIPTAQASQTPLQRVGYMSELFGPGEAQCAGWPIEQHSGAVYSETPHGCIWVTQSNGGFVPPAPTMAGLVIDQELSFDVGAGVATMTEALLDQIVADPTLARVGFDWTQDPAAGVYTLVVESYSYATLLGIEDGDVLLSVGLGKDPVDVDSLAYAYAELRRDGVTQFMIGRGATTFAITLVLEPE